MMQQLQYVNSKQKQGHVYTHSVKYNLGQE